MKKIILENENSETIPFREINEHKAIFAKDEDGNFRGMIRKEMDGWILATGAQTGATGYHKTLKECLGSCAAYGYEFFT